MTSLSVLGMLALAAVLVLGQIVLIVRFDLGRRIVRRRYERRVRRGTARLVAEAERLQRRGLRADRRPPLPR